MKSILVTGGNRGIGKEICRQLSELGHRVFMGCRSLEQGAEAAQGMDNVEVVQLDVSSDDSVKEAYKLLNNSLHSLDVLINNAGIGVGRRGLVNPNIEEVKQIMETNFYGPMRMNGTFMPLIKSSDAGIIINISSGMGAKDDLVGGYAGYRMSKWGLNGQTILLSNELRGTGIRVATMCPGWVRTDMGGPGASRPVERGADTAVWLATTDEWETGNFWRDRKVIPY